MYVIQECIDAADAGCLRTSVLERSGEKARKRRSRCRSERASSLAGACLKRAGASDHGVAETRSVQVVRNTGSHCTHPAHVCSACHTTPHAQPVCHADTVSLEDQMCIFLSSVCGLGSSSFVHTENASACPELPLPFSPPVCPQTLLFGGSPKSLPNALPPRPRGLFLDVHSYSKLREPCTHPNLLRLLFLHPRKLRAASWGLFADTWNACICPYRPSRAAQVLQENASCRVETAGHLPPAVRAVLGRPQGTSLTTLHAALSPGAAPNSHSVELTGASASSLSAAQTATSAVVSSHTVAGLSFRISLASFRLFGVRAPPPVLQSKPVVRGCVLTQTN